jgi:hypothetical protein
MYTNSELIGSILTDLNEMMKYQAAGQFLQATTVFVGIVQKLVQLRQHIDDDLKNRDETIQSLKDELRACGREVVDIPATEFTGADMEAK